jgi:hypothetical protein
MILSGGGHQKQGLGIIFGLRIWTEKRRTKKLSKILSELLSGWVIREDAQVHIWKGALKRLPFL